MPHAAKKSEKTDEKGTIIIGMDTASKSVHERTVYFDILFRATIPNSEDQRELIINVEIQNDFYTGYPMVMRGDFYCSRLKDSQSGREFADFNYDKVTKTPQTTIVPNVLCIYIN